MNASPEIYNVGGVELPRPFQLVRLGHLGLWDPKIERCQSTFVDLLGLRYTDDVRVPTGEVIGFFTTCNTDHHALIAMDPTNTDPLRKAYFDAGITLNQLSFQVNSLQEINDAHSFFQRKGVEISRIGRDLPGSNWAVYAFDPDGHRVELFYGMEQIGWNGLSKPAAMYQRLPHTEFELPQRAEALEVQEALANGIDLCSGFGRLSELPYSHDVGGVLLQRPFKVTRVGPVRMFVADIDASELFYTEIIGLQKTQEVIYKGHRCVYLRAGSEHHSVALMPLALREELKFSAKTTLMSLGLQVQTYSQLRAAREFLRSNGLTEVELPCELHPGIQYAAHFMLDDMHRIELYFDMEQIGWNGQPCPDTVPVPVNEWPETLTQTTSIFAGQIRQGPMA
ncbi:extradiol dioxygenase [Diaphorobacter sp. HDW4A]|uniref:VOC family protein n=1 Tax=Diaphorobacter sp. HDW4A TaxID=2714924 RepID=UPI0014095AFA|nr:VOC family protein [Diaphorobacter sp. HDW4A]QIL79416.1 extradiol dioxygenase [Diaphorobacter sp. HDW4A]